MATAASRWFSSPKRSGATGRVPRGLPRATEVDAGRAVSNPSVISPRSVSGGDVRILGPSRVFSRRRVAGSRRKPLERVISPTSSRSTLQLGVDSPLIVCKGRIDSGRRRVRLMAGTISSARNSVRIRLPVSAIGWLIVVLVVLIVVAVAFVIARRRRRGGGVIATKGKR